MKRSNGLHSKKALKVLLPLPPATLRMYVLMPGSAGFVLECLIFFPTRKRPVWRML